MAAADEEILLMKNLTAEKCRNMLGALLIVDERSTKEDYYLQALEIALPILEQNEAPTDTYRQIENDEDRGDDEAFWDADYD
jgi:hypothetical protein